jgi:hypothetical protein
MACAMPPDTRVRYSTSALPSLASSISSRYAAFSERSCSAKARAASPPPPLAPAACSLAVVSSIAARLVVMLSATADRASFLRFTAALASRNSAYASPPGCPAARHAANSAVRAFSSCNDGGGGGGGGVNIDAEADAGDGDAWPSASPPSLLRVDVGRPPAEPA